MKGISAVVASILLLIIAVIVVGLASGFIQRAVGIAGAGAEQQTQSTITQLSKTVKIDNAVSGNIVIKRAESATANTPISEVRVFINGVLADCGAGWAGDIDASGKVCTATCTSGQTIKVTAPGNEATRLCA